MDLRVGSRRPAPNKPLTALSFWVTIIQPEIALEGGQLKNLVDLGKDLQSSSQGGVPTNLEAIARIQLFLSVLAPASRIQGEEQSRILPKWR